MLKNYQNFWKKPKSEDLLLKESNFSKEELKEKEKEQEGIEEESILKERTLKRLWSAPLVREPTENKKTKKMPESMRDIEDEGKNEEEWPF